MSAIPHTGFINPAIHGWEKHGEMWKKSIDGVSFEVTEADAIDIIKLKANNWAFVKDQGWRVCSFPQMKPQSQQTATALLVITKTGLFSLWVDEAGTHYLQSTHISENYDQQQAEHIIELISAGWKIEKGQRAWVIQHPNTKWHVDYLRSNIALAVQAQSLYERLLILLAIGWEQVKERCPVNAGEIASVYCLKHPKVEGKTHQTLERAEEIQNLWDNPEQADVEALKQAWLKRGKAKWAWNLPLEPGYEHHRVALLQFREAIEMKENQEAIKKSAGTHAAKLSNGYTLPYIGASAVDETLLTQVVNELEAHGYQTIGRRFQAPKLKNKPALFVQPMEHESVAPALR